LRVLGTGEAAEQVARALDLALDATADPTEAYVAVLEGEDAFMQYEDLTRTGANVVALVAWGVPSPVLARLAPSSPPLVVGCPDAWSLQAALDKGNDPETLAYLERMARAEAHLASGGGAS
jgi:hypothetical protein